MRNTAVFLTISISILSVTVFTMSIYAQPPQEYVTGEVYNSSGGLVASVWVILRQGNNEKGRSLTGPLRLLSPLCPLRPLALPSQPLDASNNRLIVFNVHLHGKHSAFIKLSDFPSGSPCFATRPNSERGAKKERCCTTVG